MNGLTHFRMDPELIKMRAEMLTVADKPDLKKAVEKNIQEREQFLRPVYQQVAIQFADLHDTPERMLEKGVIQVMTN
jgi:acetyl-CoA carboxylase/biotin carboxylase 1